MKSRINVSVVILTLVLSVLFPGLTEAKGNPGVKPAPPTACATTGTVIRHDVVFADVLIEGQPCFPFEYGFPYGWTYDPDRPSLGAQVDLTGLGGTWEVGFNLYHRPDSTQTVTLVRFDVWTAHSLGMDPFPPTGETVEIGYDVTLNRAYFR